jgi:phage host-nuclease inhibitor protein Gam
MGKPKKLKVAATQYKVPQSREEVTQAILQIGLDQRERLRVETAMNDEIAAIKTKYETQAAPLNDNIVQLQAGVQIWCEANRTQLTNDGKVKTVNFGSGDVRWRMTPKSVTLKKVKAVLAALRKQGLKRFIREKEEVNKEQILAEPDAVKDIAGITISQHEEFVIEPFEAKLEEAV